MQKVYDLLQGLLGLVLTGHILEGDARLLFHIDLGLALADGHTSAHSAAEVPHEEAEQQIDGGEGDHIAQKNLEQGRHLVRQLMVKLDVFIGLELWDQIGIAHETGVVDELLRLRLRHLLPGHDQDPVGLDLHLSDLILIQHLLEFVVLDLLHSGRGIAAVQKIDEEHKHHRQNGNGQDRIESRAVLVVLAAAGPIGIPIIWCAHKHASFGTFL